jgi:hypothetical protein
MKAQSQEVDYDVYKIRMVKTDKGDLVNVEVSDYLTRGNCEPNYTYHENVSLDDLSEMFFDLACAVEGFANQ